MVGWKMSQQRVVLGEREREISFPRKQVGIFLEEGVQALCVFCVSISWCV